MADEKLTPDSKPTPQPVRRGVMDIQRPRVTLPAPVAPAAPVVSEPVATPVPVSTPEVVEQPTVPEPAVPAPVSLPTQPNHSAGDKPAALDHTAEQHSHDDPHKQMLAAAHGSKKSAPVAVIVVAVIVAVGMAGLTVFAYMKTKDSTKSSGDQTHQEMSTGQHADTTSTKAATTSDVDDATKSVDSAIAGDESTDMPESDLSDQALGLQ